MPGPSEASQQYEDDKANQVSAVAVLHWTARDIFSRALACRVVEVHRRHAGNTGVSRYKLKNSQHTAWKHIKMGYNDKFAIEIIGKYIYIYI